MAFKITISGEDTLEDALGGGHKAAFEKQLVSDTNIFIEQLKKLSNVTLTKAEIHTDTQDDVSFLPEPEKSPEKAPKESKKDS